MFVSQLDLDDFLNLTDGHEKLNKNRFKQFLDLKYGSILADKLLPILDFTSGVIDFKHWKEQIEQLLKERNLLFQIAFDIFDANNDDKISSLDLFKVMSEFSKHTLP